MISLEHKFIFIHIPKTGGSSLEHVLAPYSEDEITAPRNYDGHDLIEIAGISPHKHASLQDYFDLLGAEEFAKFKVMTIVRNPWDRAISFYFSPHRWVKRTFFGKRDWPSWQELTGFELSAKELRRRLFYGSTAQTPKWDPASFLNVLDKLKPMESYLTVNGTYQAPDITIRFEDYDRGVKGALLALGLPDHTDMALPHVNKAAYGAPNDYATPALLQRVAEKFKADIAHFQYALPPSVQTES